MITPISHVFSQSRPQLTDKVLPRLILAPALRPAEQYRVVLHSPQTSTLNPAGREEGGGGRGRERERETGRGFKFN